LICSKKGESNFMEKLIIEGGRPLEGRIRVSGSKNAALPILLASLAVDGPVTYTNVPNLRDINTTLRLLDILGCGTTFENGTVTVTPGTLVPEAPYELVKTMRASVLCLGPLLARLCEARVSLPGGCAIGSRPVDLHLKALEKMGATFDLEQGYIHGTCDGRLRGAHIQFDFPTVGGTENLLMAAALAEGETVLVNAAREPEVVDLANFLCACGAKITGQGTSIITIEGVERLSGCEYRIMPDRIEAGTYLCAAAITDGELLLEDCPMFELEAVIAKLREMGVYIEEKGDVVVARRNGGGVHGVDVVTLPFLADAAGADLAQALHEAEAALHEVVLVGVDGVDALFRLGAQGAVLRRKLLQFLVLFVQFTQGGLHTGVKRGPPCKAAVRGRPCRVGRRAALLGAHAQRPQRIHQTRELTPGAGLFSLHTLLPVQQVRALVVQCGKAVLSLGNALSQGGKVGLNLGKVRVEAALLGCQRIDCPAALFGALGFLPDGLAQGVRAALGPCGRGGAECGDGQPKGEDKREGGAAMAGTGQEGTPCSAACF
jgi:UDP-N-acetylglucosamine 1-carboxyvinyltransferase